ncbi:hypothetical protein [Xanthomonas arboricola]|uniref:hypothetical protein n=1 Tax=Xanthomonas arboricola TaxID=56448 RepID=UPI00063E9B72|nr:hypothetical protein [Xanthomonas arboricola]MBB6573698.1 hypothetical protein [Xanthomonas arboricola]PPT88737.1 hypothetical protein XarbCFBP8149_06420 [Xanthomonas arboricola]PPU12400.1 hypothetical protein XarjCFBP1022_09180 [Xanthomonas arboricola]
MLDLAKRLEWLEGSHSRLLARTTALKSVVEVLAWGCWHDRSEVADRLLETGKRSLAAINTTPEALQQEVINVWNQAHRQLVDPDADVWFIGISPE